jgi:hypothetical protein
MVPYRMDSAAPANVLKRSSSNEAFYSGPTYNVSTYPPPTWAANFSSTNPGTGNRSISLARWNEPLLMPTADTTKTNLTPVSTFIPPDWIYQTRTSGFATLPFSQNYIPNTLSGALNGNTVVGRFAYVVYDEGGLLDANAAGYPSVAEDTTAITPVMMRHKISEACADLTQIGLNSSDITNLVYWRNPSSAATATTYTNYVYSPNTNAFLTPATGDRLFTSRQQLIDFFMQDVAVSQADIIRLQGALPYLTTFSRELNAPCWYPQTNMATAGYAYSTIATNTPASATNAFAPLARANATYTNTSGLTFTTNQPVAFSRFPLSRLAWITLNGNMVQQSFGLVWDSSGGGNGTNHAWIYAGPTGSTVTGTITPLSQITKREPNFFEILKAAILSGSVGIVPAPMGSPFPNPGAIDDRYTNYDQHVMQIGLSMIDQASPFQLPTRIEFGTSTPGDWNGTLYGNKNLPYLYKMVFSPYRPTTEPSDAYGYARTWLNGWAEPVFWNPYQTVVTNTSPLSIRVRADGTNSTYFPGQIGAETEGFSTEVHVCQPEIPCGPGGLSTTDHGGGGASIEIDSPNAATFCSAATNPVLLANFVTNSAYSYVISDLRAGPPGWTSSGWSPPATTNADVYTESSSSSTYAGFWLGQTYAPNPPDPGDTDTNAAGQPATNSTSIFYYSTVSTSGPRYPHQFVLEANYGTSSSPNWQEVEKMRYEYTSGSYVEEYDNFTTAQRRLNLFTMNDPRTGRFSFDIMQPPSYNPSAPSTPNPAPLDTVAPVYTAFMSATNNYFAGYFSGTQARGITRAPVTSASITISPVISPSANPSTYYMNTFRWADNTATSASDDSPVYQDKDGTQRPADGWWSSATANTLPEREDGQQYRPVMLSRPFYSVGELGYVSRDMPWKSLDFSTPLSGDAGLLDYFCVNDGYAGSTNAPVVAGVLDLNTAQTPVLQAMLNGAPRAQLFPANDITAPDASTIAAKITSITATAPLLNKSEIATRLAPADPTVTSSSNDSNIKERREALVRALASVGQVRTWNLMIDVVAQTGHFPPGATGFNNFLVTAEQRYWAHVAIDRYSGQVVSVQLEPVSE